jgi:hypothetical protein
MSTLIGRVSDLPWNRYFFVSYSAPTFRASSIRDYFLSISGSYLTRFSDWLSDRASLYIAHFLAPTFVTGRIGSFR